MTDTTNTMPPLPVHPYGQALWTWSASERRAIIAYGDARAAHAVAQIKAREVTDAEIDALCKDFERLTDAFARVKHNAEHAGDDLARTLRSIVFIADAAIALANGRG